MINGINHGKNEPDWYGKFSVSWTGSTTGLQHLNKERRLNHWLDPNGRNLTVIDGMSLPPVISGPTLVCYHTTHAFSITNAPAVFSWDTSPNIGIKSTTDNTVTVSGTTGHGPGWISVKLNGKELARKNVWVGAPIISHISVQTPIYEGHNKSYEAILSNSLSAPISNSYEWELDPQELELLE